MKILRYLVVGGCAASLDFSIFVFAVKLLYVPWFIAAIASFIAGTALNYVLSINFVFKSGARFEKNAEMAIVLLVSCIGLVINQIILLILISLMTWNIFLAKITATFLVFIWNYTIRKNYVFRAT